MRKLARKFKLHRIEKNFQWQRLDDCQSTHQDASCYIIAVSTGLLLVLGGVQITNYFLPKLKDKV